MRVMAFCLIRAYQILISPLYPQCCRFVPSCSEYALEAIQVHGVFRGGWLALRRVFRCHPLTRGGYDPVPGTDAMRIQTLHPAANTAAHKAGTAPGADRC